MQTFHDAGLEWEPADPDHFTGVARVKRVAVLPGGAELKIYRVAFEPGARTDWHAHSGPQLLYVVEGRCRVQTSGEAVKEVGPGDTVYIAPDEKHWHGAAPATGTVHIAVNIDAQTTWMECVSEEQYR